MFSGRGSGEQAVRNSRPAIQNRCETGQGLPKLIRLEWMRFFNITRWRTRWTRNRARSRSARTAGSGSQVAGTRSCRLSSAST